MTILFLADANSIHFLRWYEYFINKNFNVHLVSTIQGSTLSHRCSGLYIHTIKVKKINNKYLNFLVTIFMSFLFIGKVKKIIADISPDIIHSHGVYPYGLWGSILGIKNFIVTPVGSDVVIRAQNEFIFRFITKYVFSKVKILTGDSLVLEEACKRINPSIKYKLIHNGVDQLKFYPSDKHNAKTKLGFEINGPLIFYARGFTKLYNIDKILDSIPLIIKRYPNCKLVLSHHFGNLEKKYMKKVEQLGIQKVVSFIGFINHEEINTYYQVADIVLSVPSSDNSPSSVYEAMACGIPTVISNLQWCKYAMKHKINTFILEEITPECIASAVIELLSNSALKKQIIDNGIETVKNYFSYNKNMQAMQILYYELVKNSNN